MISENKKTSKILLIMTTVGNADDAKRIARTLVEEKLAACVSYTDIKSNYYWEGKIVDDNEFLLFIKTSKEKKKDILDWLSKNHPYSVPEILVFDVESSDSYYQWLTGFLLGK